MKRLELLDYGRFFAATIVVLFHYTFNGIANGKISSIEHIPGLIEFTKYGYLGVELFFMVSGYVIFFSAKNRTADQFAVSRAIRLYPSYWFAVLFTATVALFWGGALMSVQTDQVIVNLTMISKLFGYTYVDGVYWTLMYELSFYFAVFVILIIGLQSRLEMIFILWPLLMLAALLADQQQIPYLGSYYYYFAAGALFAIIKDNKPPMAYLSLLITFALCINFTAGKAASLSKSSGVEYSGIIIALIIISFYIFFFLLNSKKGESLSLPKSRLLGALTYPVYLIHAHFGYMFISQFANNQNKYVIYLLTIFIVLAVSYFMHMLIERKLANLWRTFFKATVGVFTIGFERKIKPIRQACNNLVNQNA